MSSNGVNNNDDDGDKKIPAVTTTTNNEDDNYTPSQSSDTDEAILNKKITKTFNKQKIKPLADTGEVIDLPCDDLIP